MKKVLTFNEFIASKSPSEEEKGTHEVVNAHYSQDKAGEVTHPNVVNGSAHEVPEVKGNGGAAHIEPAKHSDMGPTK